MPYLRRSILGTAWLLIGTAAGCGGAKQVPLIDGISSFQPSFWEQTKVDATEVDQSLLETCRTDYRKHYGNDLALESILADEKDERWFFVLNDTAVADQTVVYVHDRKAKRFIHKFFVPGA